LIGGTLTSPSVRTGAAKVKPFILTYPTQEITDRVERVVPLRPLDMFC